MSTLALVRTVAEISSHGRSGQRRYSLRTQRRQHASIASNDVGRVSLYSIYLLRCRDDSIYTGIATDVERRLSEHNGGSRGAKYLRGRGPVELIYKREIGNRSVATQLEAKVKRLPSGVKADVKNLPAVIEQLLTI